MVRNIFYGVPYDPFEVQKLQELYEYLVTHQFFEIAQEFPEYERLKFLHANEFKVKETVVSLLQHFRWRIEMLPCKMTKEAIRWLVISSFINLVVFRIPVCSRQR